MATYYEEALYDVKIISQQLRENNKGNPELVLGIKPFRHADAGHNIDDGKPRAIYLTLTENTLGTPSNPGWVLQTLQWLGFTGTSFAQLDPEHPQAVLFEGKEVQALCKHEEYNGKENEKWSFWRGRSNTAAKPVEKKTIRALDSKFKSLLKTFAATGAEPATVAAVGTVAETGISNDGPDESDIPF